jgi:hypothetical protein
MATHFSQRDPLWASKRLGTSPLTIGKAGCLITCVSGLLCDFGVATDPGRLNTWLIATRGYVDDNLFVFKSVEPYGVTFEGLTVCRAKPAPLQTIEGALSSDNRQVIVMVDFNPGGAIQQHWVRLLTNTDDISDPWRLKGSEQRNLSDYFAPGWDAARAIMAVAIYKRDSDVMRPRVINPRSVDSAEVQPFVCIRE